MVDGAEVDERGNPERQNVTQRGKGKPREVKEYPGRQGRQGEVGRGQGRQRGRGSRGQYGEATKE